MRVRRGRQIIMLAFCIVMVIFCAILLYQVVEQ